MLAALELLGAVQDRARCVVERLGGRSAITATPRFTAGRSPIASSHRLKFFYVPIYFARCLRELFLRAKVLRTKL
jgi:hypothetical protein